VVLPLWWSRSWTARRAHGRGGANARRAIRFLEELAPPARRSAPGGPLPSGARCASSPTARPPTGSPRSSTRAPRTTACSPLPLPGGARRRDRPGHQGRRPAHQGGPAGVTVQDYGRTRCGGGVLLGVPSWRWPGGGGPHLRRGQGGAAEGASTSTSSWCSRVGLRTRAGQVVQAQPSRWRCGCPGPSRLRHRIEEPAPAFALDLLLNPDIRRCRSWASPAPARPSWPCRRPGAGAGGGALPQGLGVPAPHRRGASGGGLLAWRPRRQAGPVDGAIYDNLFALFADGARGGGASSTSCWSGGARDGGHHLPAGAPSPGVRHHRRGAEPGAPTLKVILTGSGRCQVSSAGTSPRWTTPTSLPSGRRRLD